MSGWHRSRHWKRRFALTSRTTAPSGASCLRFRPRASLPAWLRGFAARPQKLAAIGITVIGLSPGAWSIPGLAVELVALEHVREDHPELQGDRVARTEVLARIGAVRERLESDFARALR